MQHNQSPPPLSATRWDGKKVDDALDFLERHCELRNFKLYEFIFKALQEKIQLEFICDNGEAFTYGFLDPGDYLVCHPEHGLIGMTPAEMEYALKETLTPHA